MLIVPKSGTLCTLYPAGPLSQEEGHPQERADASSCDRHPDKGRFRYAPLPSAGLPFVDSEYKEGQDINANEIYNDCSQVRLVVR